MPFRFVYRATDIPALFRGIVDSARYTSIVWYTMTNANGMEHEDSTHAYYTDPLSYLKVSTHAKGPPHGPFEDVEVAEGPREVRVQQPERRPQCLTK